VKGLSVVDSSGSCERSRYRSRHTRHCRNRQRRGWIWKPKGPKSQPSPIPLEKWNVVIRKELLRVFDPGHRALTNELGLTRTGLVLTDRIFEP
jgi:hypothetical protein